MKKIAAKLTNQLSFYCNSQQRNLSLKLSKQISQGKQKQQYFFKNSKIPNNLHYLGLSSAALFSFFFCGYNYYFKNNFLVSNDKKLEVKADEFVEGLPYFSEEEVSEHVTLEKGIWVTYKKGVYDVTKFLPIHPGADKIMLAKGSAIDPYWNVYQIHNQQHVYSTLEKYRIGNLKIDPNKKQQHINIKDPYANDPYRLPSFIIHNKKPFNAEPPLELLEQTFITPNEFFFIRNHLPVPDVDADNYKLDIDIDLEVLNQRKQFSLEDLKKNFKKFDIIATIQCTGNRRSLFNQKVTDKHVMGLQWGGGAIGNAKWGGVKLRDVLLSFGLKEHQLQGYHLIMEGLDQDMVGNTYETSIPLLKALDFTGDVILCYEMNGEPLPRDHGYPLRMIVPGYNGARSVKWLKRLTIKKQESQSVWTQKDYKIITDVDNPNYKGTLPINETPIVSHITSHKNEQKISINQNEIEVRGYAYAGGGRKVVDVRISADDCQTFKSAEIINDLEQENYRAWAWVRWKGNVEITDDMKPGDQIKLCTNAVDSHFNQQAHDIRVLWNIRGFANSSYHKLNINLVDPDLK